MASKNKTNSRSRNYKNRATKQAKEGNFQDAAELEERSKGSKNRRGNNKRANNVAYPVNTNSFDNDPRWYGVNPTLLRDSANIPFARSTGSPIIRTPRVNAVGTAQSNGMESVLVPGILTVSWIPSVGMATDPTDAVNVAANALYSYVRHANAGHTNYDAPDLMLYILAMDSAYAWYSAMVRAYGIISNYEMMNRYTPQALVQALGFDWGSLSMDLANFRMVINQYAYKLASLAVPVDIYYITRHIWMNENIYTDANTTKAQYYAYVQEYYYQWSELTTTPEDPKFELRMKYRPGSSVNLAGTNNKKKAILANLKQIQDFCDAILNPIIASEDMNIMSGDILKAFGADNLFKVHGIDETYMVTPVYNQEVLSQIENCFTLPACVSNQRVGGPLLPTNTTAAWCMLQMGTISQANDINQGYLVEDVRITSSTAVPDGWDPGTAGATNKGSTYVPFLTPKRQVINFHHESPTPDEVMVATRMTNFGTAAKTDSIGGNDGVEGFAPGSTGSEIPLYFNIWVNNVAGNYSDTDIGSPWLQWARFGSVNTYIIDAENHLASGSQSNMEMLIDLLSKFDWHPQISFAGIKVTSAQQSSASVSAPIFDYEIVTQIDADTLNNMHRVALLSLLNCQRLGAFTPKV